MHLGPPLLTPGRQLNGPSAKKDVATTENAPISHHVLVVVIVVVVHGAALGHPATAAASAHPFVPSAPGTAATTPI